MNSLSDSILVLVVLLNLMLCSTSRISVCIRVAALQGMAIGALPLMIAVQGWPGNALIIAAAAVILKGWVFPRLLLRAQREANIQRDIEPLIGYPLSVLFCVFAFMTGVWFSGQLPLTEPVFSKWALPVCFATILTGFLIIISRTKALTQVIGYLVIENGIYLFGIALLLEQPLLVELAILLDVFAAVFVMGITIFHISREFDHIDTQRLSELKDVAEQK